MLTVFTFYGSRNDSMANEFSIANPTVKNLGTLLWYFSPFKLKLNDVGLQCLKIICQCLAIGVRFPPHSTGAEVQYQQKVQLSLQLVD